jgi:hypothetical protein
VPRPTPTAPPIFIIGCPRSGTTLVRMIVDSHPRISAGEETKFLFDLQRILGDHQDLVSRYGFGREYWLERIRDFYGGFQAEYMRRRGKARWAEKTPEYTLILDFIDELFPDARYIHVIRDGRDVVASFRERWGYRAALRVARGVWVSHVTAARDFGRRVAGERYTEIRYERLVAEPEAVLRDLFRFLDEPWDPVVLRWDELHHDTTDHYAGFTADRRRAGRDPAAIYRWRVGAGGSKLDPLLRLIMRRRSWSLLRELGYT